MSGVAVHQLIVRSPTAARERVERVLGVKTTCTPLGYDGKWAIVWTGPTVSEDDLDFLRPDVLPPRETA